MLFGFREEEKEAESFNEMPAVHGDALLVTRSAYAAAGKFHK
jgi:hypothetical protein